MPQALAKVVLHIVFSTKGREPWLQDRPLRRELHRYMGGIIGRLDCIPIQIGGI
jgi:putative transposase